MAVATLYRRILPSPPAIDFASSEGKQLFSEALHKGTMEGFFKLISHFKTQSEPAFCGLATLTVVLNALAIDPGRTWKGPWRWFDESMLDCCEPLEKVKTDGITFGKVMCLARCAGAKVESFRTNQSNVDDFRKHVINCASSEDCHLVTSYHRKSFKQTGGGHFSPIGGYHAGRDMALILDVARFKYPPHWVPLTLLWEAMDTTDENTGLPRGFMLISRLPKSPLLYTLSCRDESWVSMTKYLTDDVPVLLKTENLDSVPALLSLLLKSLPGSAGNFIKWVIEVRRQEEGGLGLSKEEKEWLALKEEVLQQIRETQLFKVVIELAHSKNLHCPHCSCSSAKESLAGIAANVCCEGAALLTGNPRAGEGFCCRETCVKCVKTIGDGHVTVISGKAVSGGNEQGVDMLLPTSQSEASSGSSSDGIVKFPSSTDVLTVLLLALNPLTWSGIKNERLKAEIQHLVSTDVLPEVLQQEVLHLRYQLHYLKGCKDKMGDSVRPLP